MVGTIFIPQYLGTLRMILSKPDYYQHQTVFAAIRVFFAPINSYILHFMNLLLDLKLRKFPDDSVLMDDKESLKRDLNGQIKFELGLETIYQLVIQVMLLLLAYTTTPTENGLKTVFNEGLGGWALFGLITSILLSFNSCISSHCKALTACRQHFPFKSKVTASLYCLIGCLVRVTVIIMFFTGPLGLFDIAQVSLGSVYGVCKVALQF